MIYLAIQFVTALALFATYAQGWFQTFVLFDTTGIGQAIFLLAALGGALAARLWRRPDDNDRHDVAMLCSWCARLGLAGTLIGVYVSVSQIRGAMSASEAQALIVAFSEGIGIAVRTSIVGVFAVLYIQANLVALRRWGP